MLDLLRDNSRSFLIYLMFAIIIIVFAFTFGAITPDQACGGQQGANGATELADVDGTTVQAGTLGMVEELSISPPSPRNKSSNAISRLQQYMTFRYPRLGLTGRYTNFGPAPDEISPIAREKFLEDLVETTLVSNYARSLGMEISDTEMSTRLGLLTSNWVDEKTGEFDAGSFERWIGNLGATPSAFERFVKDELLRERVIKLLVGGVEATDADVAADYRLNNDKIKVDYIEISKLSARDLAPVTDEEVTTWLQANQAKVQTYYDENKAREFTTPAKFGVRGIKFAAVPQSTIDNDATDEQKEGLRAERAAVKKTAGEVLTALTEGLKAEGAKPVEVFAALAKTHSADASKANGGAIAGQRSLTELRRAPFGPGVATDLTGKDTGYVSGVVEVDDGFWILRVDSKTAEVVAPMGKVQMGVARDMLRDEKVGAFKDGLADAVLAAAKAAPASSLADIAKQVNAKYGVTAEGKGLKVSTSLPFSRTDGLRFIGGIGKSPDLAFKAFAASAEAPFIDGLFKPEPGDKAYVARFNGREEFVAQTEEDAAKSKGSLSRAMQYRLYRSWYKELKAQKIADGDLELSDEWNELLKQERNTYQEQGGQLPVTAGVTPAPAAAE